MINLSHSQENDYEAETEEDNSKAESCYNSEEEQEQQEQQKEQKFDPENMTQKELTEVMYEMGYLQRWGIKSDDPAKEAWYKQLPENVKFYTERDRRADIDPIEVKKIQQVQAVLRYNLWNEPITGHSENLVLEWFKHVPKKTIQEIEDDLRQLHQSTDQRLFGSPQSSNIRIRPVTRLAKQKPFRKGNITAAPDIRNQYIDDVLRFRMSNAINKAPEDIEISKEAVAWYIKNASNYASTWHSMLEREQSTELKSDVLEYHRFRLWRSKTMKGKRGPEREAAAKEIMQRVKSISKR